ncbi:MAG: histidine kinase N-terminal 7TM domain-containing protein [Syntrophobacteraceae bacterium]
MTWSYQYTPYIWPVLTSAVFSAALGIYCLRRRSAPGALALGIMTAWAVLWVLANGLGLVSADDSAKVFWFKFQAAFVLPMTTAVLCFSVEYAGLGRWLTRRMLALLVILPFIFMLLILTNETHRLVWQRIWFDGAVHLVRGPAHWAAIGYSFLLSLLHLMVLTWLFIKSPRHRWIATGLIIALLGMRGASLLFVLDWNPFKPLNPLVLVLNFALIPYAFTIVRFRMFDIVPVARDAAFECMADGLMVLDVENRIADINNAAQRLLGVTGSKVIGRHVDRVLAAYPNLLDFVLDSGQTEREVSFGDTNACCYQVSISPIIDRRDFKLGRFIALHDITIWKQTRAKLLDQERTLAMLKERELLGRELHDGIGQMAAAAHLQVKCAIELLARGDAALVESSLQSLADTTQEVKKSVRDYLLGVTTGSSAEQDFLTGIRKYIDQYSQKYGIHTELVFAPGVEEQRIDSTIQAQLQPIIQEALTNARKHSGARSARIAFAACENQVRVTIEDHGRGFDPEAVSDSRGFGLRSMRGRAEAMGGRLEINSAPGKGTLVSIQVPLQKEEK